MSGGGGEGGVVFLLADDGKMKSGVRDKDSLLSIFFSFPREEYPVTSHHQRNRHQEIYILILIERSSSFTLNSQIMKFKVRFK